MPRRREVPKRDILPDPKFGSVDLSKFMNVIMESGKDPLEIFVVALNNIKPMVEVKSRRVGGANYQVPVEVPQRRARTLAVRWLVTFARDRREKGMSNKLANEILDALNQQGGAFKRKDDVYRMAQANKAFAHYRW